MTKSFDPYREWLGIAEGRDGADYYRIFGLPPFAADPQLVAAAADLTIDRVRKLAPATHRELHQQLLEQLAAARACLLDSKARAAYDEKLRSQHGIAPSTAAPIAEAIPVEPPPEAESPGEDVWKQVSQTAQRMDYAQRRKASTASGTKIAIGLAGGLLIALAAMAFWQFNADDRPQTLPATVASAPAPPASANSVAPAEQQLTSTEPKSAEKQLPAADAALSKETLATPSSETPFPAKAEPEPQPALQPPSESPASESPPASTPMPALGPAAKSADDNAPNQAFKSAMQQARASLVARNMTAASRALEIAEKAAAGQSQRLQVARLRELGKQYVRFLAAVRSGWQKYEATEEISWNGKRAAIIEVSPDRVALFIEGQPRQFSISDIPADLALFFASAAADPDVPQAWVFYGAFHAIDPRADREQARSLWQRAKAADLPVDLLLPLLDEPPLYDRRLAVPEEALVEAARDKFLGQFAEAILAATTGPQRSRLASRLLETAMRSNDPLQQYAALQEAREWAISGGDPVTALAACNALGKTYAVDVLELSSDSLGASLAGPVSASAAAKAAQAALRFSDEAEQSGRLELAGTLADTAYTAARKSRENALIRQAHERRQTLSDKR